LGGVEGENWEFLKMLRVERSGLNVAGRISKFHRHVIDVTSLDPLSLRSLGGVQCFGDLGASGRVRTMKNGRCFRDLDLIKSFSPIRPSGALKGEEMRYF